MTESQAQHSEHTAKVEAAAKKQVAADKAAREAAVREAPPVGKPTPTQEENDLAAMGVHVVDKEADGSPEVGAAPPPPAGGGETQTRQSEARKPTPQGGYQTRTAQPANTKSE